MQKKRINCDKTNTKQQQYLYTLLHRNHIFLYLTEYNGYNQKVCIICPIHGEFWQKPNTHLNGCGCYECFKKRQGKNLTDRNTKTQNIFLK